MPVSTPSTLDIRGVYLNFLKDEQLSPPLAAILSLTKVLEFSRAGTMFELVKELKDGAESLKMQSSNPTSLNAGCELFIEFVSLFPHGSTSFGNLKAQLIQQGQSYVQEAIQYRLKIANLVFDFIKDGSVILTHSFSRVVLQTLLMAHKRKRISVFVTEAKPRGLGIRMARKLTAAGIPNTVVLDSAVAFVMDKVDFVLVGTEAVVESGGLINAVGSNQIAIVAKAANKPFYALAESYKFHRQFPLSQYDLPKQNDKLLSFKAVVQTNAQSTVSASLPIDAKLPESADSITISQEEIAKNNPEIDYTRPDLISLVFSDVGSLTPEGVSQYLVGMFAG